MLQHVRQSLLDHPVGGERESRRQGARLADDLETDVQPGLPDLRDQLVQPLQARLGGAGVRIAGPAEHSQHELELLDRLAAGPLDPEQHVALPLVLLTEPHPHPAGVQGHHAHIVRDDVVELPGDPGPFLRHRQPGSLLAFHLKADGVFRQPQRPVYLATQQDAASVRHADEDGCDHDFGDVVALERLHLQAGVRRQHARQPRDPAAAPQLRGAGHGVDEDERRVEVPGGVVFVARHHPHGQAVRDQREEQGRGEPAPEQQQRPGDDRPHRQRHRIADLAGLGTLAAEGLDEAGDPHGEGEKEIQPGRPPVAEQSSQHGRFRCPGRTTPAS